MQEKVKNPSFSPVCIKGTFCFKALVILVGTPAAGLGTVHLYPQMVPGKVDGRKEGEVGIPLAATGAAQPANALQGFRGHLVAEPPWLLRQGVDWVAMATNCPALIPAPQAPQKPQAPPGTDFPRRYISCRACSGWSLPRRFYRQSAGPSLPSHGAPGRAYGRRAGPSSVPEC